MEPNCQNQPCRELTELQKRFTRFQDDTVKRLAAGDVSMATINTKLNWLIGILSGIGAAVLTLGTSAQTVRVSGLACMVQNNSESASVYMKERRADGEDVTADNGWRLAPGERTPVPFTALDLSLVASAAGTDVRVLLLDEL